MTDDTKKANVVFFITPEELPGNFYIKLDCVECGTTEFIDCEISPSTETTLFYTGVSGWKFYEEKPGDDGYNGIVCPECVKKITGKCCIDNKKVFKHYIEGDLGSWIGKKNKKILKKYIEHEK